MGWPVRQARRLQKERAVLSKRFPTFEWFSPTEPGKTYVEGMLHTFSGREYQIRLCVPLDVPNSVPVALIRRPNPLYDHEGVDLSIRGTSHSMHLFSAMDDYPSICHDSSASWTPNKSFYKVLRKVGYWLEAYEKHLLSGKPIDDFLPTK